MRGKRVFRREGTDAHCEAECMHHEMRTYVLVHEVCCVMMMVVVVTVVSGEEGEALGGCARIRGWGFLGEGLFSEVVDNYIWWREIDRRSREEK